MIIIVEFNQKGVAVRVRDAKLEDWEAIRRISGISGYMDYIGEMGPAYMDYGRIILGEDDDGPLGFLKVEEMPDRSAWLSGLRVDPSRRREGLARLLTDYATELSAKHELGFARMLIYSGNTPSIRLAEKCGFRKVIDYDIYRGSIDLTGFAESERPVSGYVFNAWKVMQMRNGMSLTNRQYARGESLVSVSTSRFSTFYHVLSGSNFNTSEGEGIVVLEKGKAEISGIDKMEEFDSGLVFEKKLTTKSQQ